jgi:hypothetical protein
MQDDVYDSPDKPLNPMPTDLLLERGGPWEVLPATLDRTIAAARRYLTDHSHPQEARQRVYDVWIEGHYRPGWQAFQPVPDAYRQRGHARQVPD